MEPKIIGGKVLTCPQYNFVAVDWAKIVLAFFIVALHAAPLQSVSDIWNYAITHYVTRIGVPFFFVCNGYFLLAQDTEGGAKRASAQVKKLLTLYLVWTVLYAPIIVYNVLCSNNYLESILKLVRSFLFVGSYSHLWYLLGAAAAIALLAGLRNRGLGWGKVMILAVTLYLLGLSYDAYYAPLRAMPIWNCPLIYWPAKFIITIFFTTRNGLFFGFPFVALGAWLAERKKLPRCSVCLTGFAAAMLVGAGEAYFLYVSHWTRKVGADMYFFLIPAILFLFCWLLQLPHKYVMGNTRVLRKFSTLVYLIHPWLLFLYPRLTTRLFAPDAFPQHSLCRYIVVSALSALLAAVTLSRERTK